MNRKKKIELKEKENEPAYLTALSEKKFSNKKDKSSAENFKKNERPDNNFIYWDLSGGLLGI